MKLDQNGKLYLELLKKVLTDYYQGEELATVPPTELNPKPEAALVEALGSFLQRQQLYLAQTVPFDPAKREQGLDWPQKADTMVGLRRLNNVQHCLETVLEDNIPGDFIETGVWRGGTCIFARAVLKAYGVTDRTVYVADSFEGMPPPNPEEYPLDSIGLHHIPYLAVSQEQVAANFEKYGLLDEQVKFLKGWFKDTLPTAPVKQIAVLRLDGDMYESTMDALTWLYPKLSPGGFCIIDDYGALDYCKQAVHDYRDRHNITEEINQIDWTGVYWRKQG
jgi:O-methyltransferase